MRAARCTWRSATEATEKGSLSRTCINNIALWVFLLLENDFLLRSAPTWYLSSPVYRFKSPSSSSLSLYREPSFGHGRLRIFNGTHAHWTWHRNNDANSAVADEVWLENLISSRNCMRDSDDGRQTSFSIRDELWNAITLQSAFTTWCLDKREFNIVLLNLT